MLGELAEGLVGEPAVGVGEELGAANAEMGGGLAELVDSHGGEFPGGGVQRRGLAVGEAEDGHGNPGVGEGGEDGPEAKGLVVGVGANGEDAGGRRQRGADGRRRCRRSVNRVDGHVRVISVR